MGLGSQSPSGAGQVWIATFYHTPLLHARATRLCSTLGTPSVTTQQWPPGVGFSFPSHVPSGELRVQLPASLRKEKLTELSPGVFRLRNSKGSWREDRRATSLTARGPKRTLWKTGLMRTSWTCSVSVSSGWEHALSPGLC